MKKTYKLFFYLMTASLALVWLMGLASQTALADVGNINRYEDYSNNSGGSSSSSDGDLAWLLYMFSYMLRSFGPVGTIVILIIVGGGYYLYKKNNFSTPTGSSSQKKAYNVDPRTVFTPASDDTGIEQQLQQIDPNFSGQKFKAWASECFMALQAAWTSRSWHTIRPFESNELFATHQHQLQEYIQQQKINVIEKINIYHVQLLSFDCDQNHDILVVRLQATIRDYVTDETRKNVLEGNPQQDYHMTYRMQFIRKHGVLTPENNEIAVTNCPNCGSPTAITSSGQCEYCQSVITTGDYSWVLNELSSM